MQQHIHVVARDSHRTRDVLARPLLQQTQRDHGSLRVAKPSHARPQPYVLLRLCDESLGVGEFVDEVDAVQRHVRPCAMMSPPAVARGIAYDSGDVGRQACALGIDVSFQQRPEHRAQTFLHTLDCVLGTQTLAARERDPPRTLREHQLPEHVEHIVGCVHLVLRCSGLPILRP